MLRRSNQLSPILTHIIPYQNSSQLHHVKLASKSKLRPSYQHPFLFWMYWKSPRILAWAADHSEYRIAASAIRSALSLSPQPVSILDCSTSTACLTSFFVLARFLENSGETSCSRPTKHSFRCSCSCGSLADCPEAHTNPPPPFIRWKMVTSFRAAALKISSSSPVYHSWVSFQGHRRAECRAGLEWDRSTWLLLLWRRQGGVIKFMLVVYVHDAVLWWWPGWWWLKQLYCCGSSCCWHAIVASYQDSVFSADYCVTYCK